MPASKTVELTEKEVQLIAKALADPRRYEIVKRLGECKDALACESVRDCFDITAPTLSHHMKELETAGLIEVQRTGKFVHYRLQRPVLRAFLKRVRDDLT